MAVDSMRRRGSISRPWGIWTRCLCLRFTTARDGLYSRRASLKVKPVNTTTAKAKAAHSNTC